MNLFIYIKQYIPKELINVVRACHVTFLIQEGENLDIYRIHRWLQWICDSDENKSSMIFIFYPICFVPTGKHILTYR